MRWLLLFLVLTGCRSKVEPDTCWASSYGTVRVLAVGEYSATVCYLNEDEYFEPYAFCKSGEYYKWALETFARRERTDCVAPR